ncbi:hypothetical protein KR52_03750 [Synechococcus sp. KORDI-52]|nr:hypothetical protein KR52_03750 [Synechococcus sp. KORDI-52]
MKKQIILGFRRSSLILIDMKHLLLQVMNCFANLQSTGNISE